MKKFHIIGLLILSICTNSVFAHSVFTHMNCEHSNYRSESPQSNQELKQKDLYHLIIYGQEDGIKKFFREATHDELIKSDSGNLVKALNRLNAKDKVTHTIWILEEIKVRDFEIKKYVYEELGKVDYNKPTFFIKQMINNYFTNFNEKEISLAGKINALQRRMNKSSDLFNQSTQ